MREIQHDRKVQLAMNKVSFHLFQFSNLLLMSNKVEVEQQISSGGSDDEGQFSFKSLNYFVVDWAN